MRGATKNKKEGKVSVGLAKTTANVRFDVVVAEEEKENTSRDNKGRQYSGREYQ